MKAEQTLPGLVATEAGRPNGAGDDLEGPYDGYAECVKATFDEGRVTVTELMGYFFEIIDPYSVNRQGADVGEKYRTGVYSEDPSHLREAQAYMRARPDRDRIRVEACPLRPERRGTPRPAGQVPRRLLPHPQGTHDEAPLEGVVLRPICTNAIRELAAV